MRFGMIGLLLLLLLTGAANGQGLAKICLADEGAGEALELAVDDIGDITSLGSYPPLESWCIPMSPLTEPSRTRL